MKQVFSVIMAGGVGSRFWPLSRERKPKQFLDILGTGRTLIQQTYDRMLRLSPPEQILVVTNQQYFDLVREQLPDIPVQNILLEPRRRNTAPCIAYAAYKIKAKSPDAVMVVTPADHLVIDVDSFVETLKAGIGFINDFNAKALVTLGIEPTRPETGYGYIQFDSNVEFNVNGRKIYKVKTFTEKPDRETAEIFIQSGEFLWNSGIFIWKVSTILDALHKYLPEIVHEFDKIQDQLNSENENLAIEQVYGKITAISIDYGVMEKEKENVYVIPSNFGWSDLGTWGSLYENYEKDEDGNVIIGNNVIVFKTSNSFVNVPDDKLVVLLGLENVIVAENDNMLLIANKDEEQHIRQIVNKIKIEKGEEYV